jgi:hypothetical protein
MKKVLFGIQIVLLILAIVATLLIGSDNEFVLLLGLPPLALSALVLIVLIVMALFTRQFRFLLKVLMTNLVVLLIGAISVFFTGRGYASYMLKSESDSISYQVIPNETVFPDSIQAFVVHESLYRRKNMFSSEYVLVQQNQWRSYHNGWIDFYRLVLEHKTDNKDISRTYRIIGVPRDSIIWMGVGRTKQQLDFRDGLIPGDTILLEYNSQSSNLDTLILVKTN